MRSPGPCPSLSVTPPTGVTPGRPSTRHRMDWPAGGPWAAGQGPCRGGIQRLHGHAMLELTPGMQPTGALPARAPAEARPAAGPRLRRGPRCRRGRQVLAWSRTAGHVRETLAA